MPTYTFFSGKADGQIFSLKRSENAYFNAIKKLTEIFFLKRPKTNYFQICMCFFKKQFNISVTFVFLYYENKVYMLFMFKSKTNKIGFAFSVKHVALRSKSTDLLVGNHDHVF